MLSAAWGLSVCRMFIIVCRQRFKCVTIGTSNILLGVLLMEGFNSIGMKIVVCTVFLIFTAPVAAHALLRGAHRSGVKMCKESIVDQYESDNREDTKE